MTESEVQGLLDSGLRLGVTKPVDSPDYLGWILVKKFSPNTRFKEILDQNKHARIQAEQRRYEMTPFLVMNIELKRLGHEAGIYKTENDCRMKTQTWCKDFKQVQDVLV
jgi:hypothetical protein